MKSLDSLLDEKYEDATFHDSALLSCAVDFGCATATFEFNIQCRAMAPGQQFSHQRGTLEFSGLYFCSVEPTTFQKRPDGGSSLWITAEGPLPDERLQISGTVPGHLPPNAFMHYLYSSSTNSFIVIAASGARFTWSRAETKIR